jgi:putative oxidoreductase
LKSLSPQFFWRLMDLLVGGIFIYAGVTKAIDPLRFAIDIDNYKMLPWAIGVGLAFYLPWLEMLCGLALILRFFYRAGLFILSALTFIFIAASIIARSAGSTSPAVVSVTRARIGASLPISRSIS